jgi:hypothetical protein
MNEFPTADEAAAYRMLKQVLQNHVALQEMSILATSMACTGLLGDRCLERYAAGTAPPEIVTAMLGWLKHGVRERQTAPTLLPFGEASAQEPDARLGEHSRCLYEVLRQLLNEVIDEQHLTLLGRMQIVLRLMADVLSMFLHQFDHSLAEIDRIIDEVVGHRWRAI